MASVDQVQKLFNSAPAAEPPAEYSIDEFDYKYLESCSDLNHLKLLLGVLKSGREGSFPDLEEAFETKISSLDPSFLTSKSMEAAHQDQERIISEINV